MTKLIQVTVHRQVQFAVPSVTEDLCPNRAFYCTVNNGLLRLGHRDAVLSGIPSLFSIKKSLIQTKGQKH